MFILVFVQVLIIKIPVSDFSVLVIKCFHEVVYHPIFYERKSVQFSERCFGKKKIKHKTRKFFHFPVELYSFIMRKHIRVLSKISFD